MEWKHKKNAVYNYEFRFQYDRIYFVLEDVSQST